MAFSPLQRPVSDDEHALHAQFGEAGLQAIYGAGCTRNPRLMLMFMNPTAKNVSSSPAWKGLNAPWVGVKKTWKMFASLGLIQPEDIAPIGDIPPEGWTPDHAHQLYTCLATNGVYVTNLAKCTQADARPLPDSIFKAYRPSVLREIHEVNPQHIVTFGNQVSCVLLGKPVSVSRYTGHQHEQLSSLGSSYKVYPTYYPVGQGQRNMPLALTRIRAILES